MEAFHRVAGATAAPDSQAVSRPELEALEAQRRAPVVERILTPDGAYAVNGALNQQREERIRYIQSRLDAAAGLAVKAHALGRTHDIAKDAFKRSR